MKRPRRFINWLYLAMLAVVGWSVLSPLTPTQIAAPAQTAPEAPTPGPSERPEYTLLFTGDVMLSRAVGARMEVHNDWSLPFRQIAETLQTADLRYCNLECPVSDRGRNLHHLYSFRADPRVIEGLTDAGFNVASQANNHAYDWGPDALLDSLDRLRAAGIQPVGAGTNLVEAHSPLIVNVGPVRIAFLAYVNIDPKDAAAGADRPGVAWLDPAQALADVQAARPLADLVIVCPHWGVEYALTPTREQTILAHQLIDAGADMIVGSHPHVVQPVENYHDHWIAYSLGNFIFDQQSPNTHRGLMLKAIVRNKRIVDVQSIPIDINSSFQACVASAPPAKPLVATEKSPAPPTP